MSLPCATPNSYNIVNISQAKEAITASVTGASYGKAMDTSD